ncbi:MAG: adenosylcobinamide-GDP ribazoletransferase [Aquabacterium sp.]
MKLRRIALHELRLLLTALQFLTRIPIPAWVGYDPKWLQDCLRYFPVVGALVGLCGALVLGAAAAWWPPVVAVVLSMAFTVWMTGGFHEDGLADTCDALGGHVSKERALEIMKDSRIGSYGTLALVLMLGLKAAVLTSLLSPLLGEMVSFESSHIRQVLLAWTMLGLIWCHTASRLVPVWLIRWLPYGGDVAHAKAKPLAMLASNRTILLATLNALWMAGAMWAWLMSEGWPTGAFLTALGCSGLAMMLGAAFCAHWFMRRLGGFTGDTLGASQQITEVMGLLAWLAVIHPML